MNDAHKVAEILVNDGIDSLRGANLYGANLINANLINANLINANLINANLINANLINANLYGANLREANLINANLYGANLREADLRGTKGIISLGFDPRGYILICWMLKGAPWFNAGCRSVTKEDALAHWGADDYEDLERGKLYIEAIKFLVRFLSE